MAVRPVHWEEGRFLRPHYFQAAQKETTYETHLSDRWNQHYNWGLRSIDLDLVALANHRFVVRSIQARFPDGTMVEESSLPVLDLNQIMEKPKTLMIFLAVPMAKNGKNVGEEGSRYALVRESRTDENDGKNPQELLFRRLNLRLLWSAPERRDHPDFMTLPIACIKKSDRMEAVPEIDTEYIPPVIANDAWKPLAHGMLESIYDFLGKKRHNIEKRVKDHRLSFDSQALGDPKIFAKLRLLNEAYTFWGIYAFAQGIHPLQAYLELCRLAGQLAIFREDYTVPTHLPKYDHDNLFKCYEAVKRFITLALEEEDLPAEVPFIGIQKRLQVDLEEEWLLGWQMFVRVRSNLSSEDCVTLLKGGLNMKIGSSETVDTIYDRRFPGLTFTHQDNPPQRLPKKPEFTYFQVDTAANKEEWNNVKKFKKLAVRFNVDDVSGEMHGQKVVTIRRGTRSPTMEFTLCLIRPEQNPASGSP